MLIDLINGNFEGKMGNDYLSTVTHFTTINLQGRVEIHFPNIQTSWERIAIPNKACNSRLAFQPQIIKQHIIYINCC
jgi:hypothetical protein